MEQRRRTRVLVAHDCGEERETLAEALERVGYAVSTASNGRDALRELALAPPDVVVLDLAIPEIGAASLLSHLRRTPELRGVRTVLVTSIGAPLARRLLAPDATLEKPVSGRALLAAIAQLEGGAESARGA